MSDVMIQVENLTKDYGPARAVDKVTFNVRKGEVLGFLGPNGAGKSTTMKMLTCFLSPTAGTAKVAGHDVFDESLEVRRRIGYLPEDTPIYRDMTVLEYLTFAAELRGMDMQKSPARIKEIGGRCGLGDVAGKLVSELSKGYRQRLGLAQAMLHDPDILILDEPTSGLDPNQIVEIRELIKEIGKERTIILSTHILSEVQATCSRILIINGGKLVADGTPESLTSREKRGRYRVVLQAAGAAFRSPEAAQEAIRTALSRLAGVSACQTVTGEDGAHTFGIDASTADDLRPLLFKAAVDNKWSMLELVRESVSLEAVFRNLTTADEPKPEPKAESTSPEAHS